MKLAETILAAYARAGASSAAARRAVRDILPYMLTGIIIAVACDRNITKRFPPPRRKIHNSVIKRSQLKSKIYTDMRIKRILVIAAAAALALAPGALFCPAAGLGLSVAVNKLVTPNGDGYNDKFIFKCYNPGYAAIDARIYTVSGRQIATMQLEGIGTSDYYYTYDWDPNSGGRWPGGVYLYQIWIGTKVYKGTVVVIR